MSRPKVLVTRPFLDDALAFLERYADVEGGRGGTAASGAELIERVADKDGLLCLLVDRIDSRVMEAAPRLRIIANCAVGYDNIDIDAARKRGIMVTNTPDVLTEATADLTWALILAVSRKIPQSDRFTREGRFTGWEIGLFLGRDIAERQLGIIGLGRIGRAVARRAHGFRMKVVYFDPKRPGVEEERTLGVTWLPLDDLLRTSDIVTIHASLNADTRHLLSAERLRLMKATAILVNVARGPIVDEDALAEALASGRIWGAGLDVYEKEPQISPRLLELDNVVLLPHIGSATEETRRRMAIAAVRNLIQGLQGERPENLVNY